MNYSSSAEQAALHYADAYQKLYKRPPRDLRILDDDWVMVYGARLRSSELQYLTLQLQSEYRPETTERRSVVMRLLKWFKS
ncbi:MAG: hypothetical protein H7175_00460 [Burkholderiales bacterium]|nr:hypothetical protein [Anaerolineae bacterium]